MKFDSNQDAKKAFELAFGRILRMGSRPSENGDVEEYERCKHIILDAANYTGIECPDNRPNYIKDYNKINHD